MQPIIKYDSKMTVMAYDYVDILSKKIKQVCSKVGFDYKGLKWIIYDPRENDILKTELCNIPRFRVGNKGKDYGVTIFPDTIGISILSIDKDIFNGNSIIKKMNPLLKNRISNSGDFLADVILDEITHVITKRDHGTDLYDKKLEEYRKRYYDTL